MKTLEIFVNLKNDFVFQLNLSNSNRVTLINVPKYLKGNFTCEVSVEEPTYSTSVVTRYLQVCYLFIKKTFGTIHFLFLLFIQVILNFPND